MMEGRLDDASIVVACDGCAGMLVGVFSCMSPYFFLEWCMDGDITNLHQMSSIGGKEKEKNLVLDTEFDVAEREARSMIVQNEEDGSSRREGTIEDC
jgi:hypothetical protein